MRENEYKWLLGDESKDSRLRNIVDWLFDNSPNILAEPKGFESYMRRLYSCPEKTFSLRQRIAKVMFTKYFDEEGICPDNATIVRDDKYGAYFTWSTAACNPRGEDRDLAGLFFPFDYHRRSRLIALTQEVIGTEVYNQQDAAHRILNTYQSDDETTTVKLNYHCRQTGSGAYQDLIEMLFPDRKLTATTVEFFGFRKLKFPNTEISLERMYNVLNYLHYSFAKTEITSSVLNELFDGFTQYSSMRIEGCKYPHDYLHKLDVDSRQLSKDQQIMYLLLLFSSQQIEWTDTNNLAYKGWINLKRGK